MNAIHRLALVTAALAACNATSDWQYGTDGGNRGSNTGSDAGSGSHHGDGGTTSDGDMSTGGSLSCPGPGNPVQNGGSCGVERWAIKTGTDSGASSIPMVAQANTIQALGAVPANPGTYTTRTSPYETTIWELKNVVVTEIKEETDSDYHLVLSDGNGNSMVAEIPWIGCASGTVWPCFISKARSDVDAKYSVQPTPVYPSATISLRGVGFFDTPHGQTGDAPNSIELHPTLEICFGRDCVLP